MGFLVFGEPFGRTQKLLGLLSGGAGVSLPTTNQLAWWDANKDVYADTGLTTPVADGGTVGGWKDQGASAYHVTQSTAGDQPIYRLQVPAFRNKPGIEFVSSDFLGRTIASAIAANLSVYTLYTVFRTTNNALVTFYSEGRSSNAIPFVALNHNGVAAQFFCRDDAGVNATSSGGTTVLNGNAHLLTLRRIAATSWSLRLDGVQVATDTDNVAATTIDRIAIGCFGRNTNSQFFVGHIAQVASYSADNFATIEPLLASFYGITLP